MRHRIMILNQSHVLMLDGQMVRNAIRTNLAEIQSNMIGYRAASLNLFLLPRWQDAIFQDSPYLCQKLR